MVDWYSIIWINVIRQFWSSNLIGWEAIQNNAFYCFCITQKERNKVDIHGGKHTIYSKSIFSFFKSVYCTLNPISYGRDIQQWKKIKVTIGIIFSKFTRPICRYVFKYNVHFIHSVIVTTWQPRNRTGILMVSVKTITKFLSVLCFRHYSNRIHLPKKKHQQNP